VRFCACSDPFSAPTAGRCATSARDLAARSAAARDAQGALDALSDLAGHGDLSQRSLATLRSRIEALRQSAETNTLNADMRLRLNRALDKATPASSSGRCIP